MRSIPESDWKVFRDLHSSLMERFCERVLKEVADAATSPKHEPFNRFSKIEKLIGERRKDLNDLGDHRRSTAFLVIARMHNAENLFLPEELERFSEATRNEVIALRSL